MATKKIVISIAVVFPASKAVRRDRAGEGLFRFTSMFFC
jgi:hypothetical protein